MQRCGRNQGVLGISGFFRKPANCWDLEVYLAPEAQQQALQREAGKKKGRLAVLLMTHNCRIYGYFSLTASPRVILRRRFPAPFGAAQAPFHGA